MVFFLLGYRMISPASLQIRPIHEDDLDAVLGVQAACYPPAMQEPRDVVLARLLATGDTTLVAVHGGALCAYAFAYRSAAGVVTPLGAAFEVKEGGDTLYIHDLSVAPAAAGLGIARQLVESLRSLAAGAGLRQCALVSVQESQPFWEKLGFANRACEERTARLALASYPAVAIYMCGDLEGGRPS